VSVVLFSAANPQAELNLQHTVVEGAGLNVLTSSRMFAELQTRAADGRVRVWGMQPGVAGQKVASWRRVNLPAVAFFYTRGAFTLAANIWAKEPAGLAETEGNPDLAEAIWDDPAFELIAYLDDVEAINVAPEVLKAALGYQLGYSLGRGTIVPSAEIQEAVLAAFGTPEAFRAAVVGHVGTPQLDTLFGRDLPVDKLGTDYRPANEDATAERNPIVWVDSDAIDRGTRGHAKTQNALAAHLTARGLQPRSPSLAEPPYDLAWEQGDRICVAEVKSLTLQNEERQLRLALGQVLRYAQQLSYKRKPIRRLIAVERRPVDATWTELCADHNVDLVWPGTFDRI